MLDFIFFIKTLAMTIVLVIFLQIQVGGRTLEDYMHNWIQTSWAAAPLNETAHNAAQIVRDVVAKVQSQVRENVNKFRGEDPKKKR